jgi:hypothetical protein
VLLNFAVLLRVMRQGARPGTHLHLVFAQGSRGGVAGRIHDFKVPDLEDAAN